MKILAVADLHGDEEALDRLRIAAMKNIYDHVFIVGDITTAGPASYADDVVSLFPSCFAVHGNMDTQEVINVLENRRVSVHGKKKMLGEWNVVGVGGSNPTPFRTPIEYSEQEIAETISKAGLDKHSILLSHPPPKGAFDQVEGAHRGSESVRSAIEQKNPLMCVCGHIHEQEGEMLLGQTLVVKLGAAKSFRAAEIEITDKIDVRFIKF
jgi:Icc-related predicted phosphoesterase